MFQFSRNKDKSMKFIFKSCFLFYILLFINFSCLFANKDQESKDFILVTIPKSGTHLITKLLTFMTGYDRLPCFNYIATYEEFESIVNDAKKHHNFIYYHSEILHFSSQFCKIHSDYVEIIAIRDLRDVLVSLMTSLKQLLHKEMGYVASENEMLTYLLNGKGFHPEYMKARLEEIVNYLQKETACLLRFENLIDSSAGGSDQVQKWHINHLAYILNIDLSDSQTDYICHNLQGNKEGTPLSPTFNVGKMGRWRNFFTEENLQLFEEKWGHYQISLGYPLREDFIPSIP